MIKAIANVEMTIEKGSLILSRKKNKSKRTKAGKVVIIKATK